MIAENLILKHQLIVPGRTMNKAPNLKPRDRFIFDGLSLLISANRRLATAVAVKPSTLLSFHRALVNRKYSHLLSSKGNKLLGPKGPSQDLIKSAVKLKQRDPRFGSPRIAYTISITFGIELKKGVVRRILAKNYRTRPRNTQGPSGLSLLNHSKNSLWSIICVGGPARV